MRSSLLFRIIKLLILNDMKKQILLLSLLAITLFSCDKEDDNPAIFFEGAYENSLSIDADKPYYFEIMTFTKAGRVMIENFVIGVESDEPCLQSYSEGTYQLIGEDFKLTLTSSFGPDPAAFDITEGCIAKEDLVNNLNPDFVVSNGVLIFGDSKEDFALQYECNDMLNSISICLGARTFEKID